MKKTLLIAALAVFSITSCSKDQVVETPMDAIKYSVVTDNATKASAVYCQNNLMSSFKVYAQDEKGKAYIKGDDINNEGTSWNSTVRRYWPEDNNLDFYAVVNSELEFTPSVDMGNAIAKITSFTPNSDVSKQVDLLYAVQIDQTKESTPVKMNFRHALSQIEFRAENLNKNLYVEIKTVKVGKVYESGSYLLPNANTSNVTNLDDHDQSEVMTGETRGNWTFGGDRADYVVAVYPTESNITGNENTAAIPYGKGVVNLTMSNDKESVSKSMLLLPTVNNADSDGLGKWVPASGLTDFNGTYLGVECTFYNVPSGEATADNIVKIDEGWAYLPVDINWEEGKKYIYTFKFTTDGNGGYEPDPDDPKPVLTPITYSVTVDDFENGGNTDLEMKK